MIQIKKFQAYDCSLLSDWALLTEATKQKFLDLLEVKSVDDLQVIFGINEEIDEIWNWRTYAKECLDLTEDANYITTEDADDVDGFEPVEIEIDFGYVALVNFIFDDKINCGLIFQDHSPAILICEKFKPNYDIPSTC
jgi:hypothetical protein